MNLQGISLTWLGHSTFRIQTPEGKTLYIDPWIAGNPMCPESEKNVKRADVLLCTHGHGDHIGDAVDVGKKLNPIAVGIFELCLWLQKKGVKLYVSDITLAKDYARYDKEFRETFGLP